MENETKLNETIDALKTENSQLKNQNQHLEEHNLSLENMCKNLESVVRIFIFILIKNKINFFYKF